MTARPFLAIDSSFLPSIMPEAAGSVKLLASDFIIAYTMRFVNLLLQIHKKFRITFTLYLTKQTFCAIIEVGV